MNEAQIHLALNHAPLFLAIAGAIILLLGMVRKNESYRSLSLYILASAAIFTIPVFLTGEGTEETVEHLPGVAEAAISEHESMAQIALVIISITGVIALAGLFLRRKETLMSLVYWLVLVFSIASFGAMAATAHLGGKIRHTELGTVANSSNEANKSEGKDEKDENEGNEKAAVRQTMPADSTAKPETPVSGKKEKDDDD